MAAHVTIDQHKNLEDRVDGHDTKLAVHDTLLASLDRRLSEAVDEMRKVRWTLIAAVLASIAERALT